MAGLEDPNGIAIGQLSGGTKQFVVTPNDNADLAVTARALYVGVGGDVAFIAFNDSSAQTWVGVTAGTIIPMYVKRVMSTNTTATSILGLY